MKTPVQTINAITPIRNPFARSPWRCGFILLALGLSLALVPAARAVSPPPDGGYANFNTAEGDNALFNLTTGFSNTAIGYDALYYNTTGSNNTAIGYSALQANTTGDNNTASGFAALYSNTTGSNNTASGLQALYHNTTGGNNTASGLEALYYNTTGFNNTASGFEALFDNTTGGNNSASGAFALFYNTTGFNNTASGYEALRSNTTGSNNTASGLDALYGNTSGGNNTAYGRNALVSNTTGSNNTGLGYLSLKSNGVGAFNTATGLSALYGNTSGSSNTGSGVNALYSNSTGGSNSALGRNALVNNTSGSNNIAVGLSAGGNLTTGSNNIMIGNVGVSDESNRIRLGTQGTQTSTYVAGISGVTVAGGVGVVVNSQGQLGVLSSSARYKEGIAPMGDASAAILALEPVSFRYKQELDPEGIPQFGLVAEEVAKVNPELVARDDQGRPYTVRYEAINAMLLNEFLKVHRKVEEQEAMITQAKTIIGKLEAAIAQQQEGFQEAIARQEKEIGSSYGESESTDLADREGERAACHGQSSPRAVASNQ